VRLGKGLLGLAVAAAAPVVAPAARRGIGSAACLRFGFLPVPIDFYSPIPDLEDLRRRRVWDVRSELPGVAFNRDYQLELLASLGAAFGHECAWPAQRAADAGDSDFYTENGSFSFGCAASTHCMIRRFKPSLVVEIGSGQSSIVIGQALAANSRETGICARHCVVDPYPSAALAQYTGVPAELTDARVELLDPHWFDALSAGDILFIDSGHTARIGGDVNFLFLEVLPRLARGVLVHLHDIPLPWDYPAAYSTRQGVRHFWTEAYLLQTFLAFNSAFEVMLAMRYLMTDERQAFQRAFCHFDPLSHQTVSGSFWVRRAE
jgi:hypothetical protein